MRAVRGIAVWLGAPVLANFLCTLAWYASTSFLHTTIWYEPANHLIWDSRDNQLLFAATGVTSLFFSIVGSAFLSILFKTMSARTVSSRYIVLIVFGAAVGFLMIAILPGGGPITIAGSIYGIATACLWVGLHQTICVRR